MSDEWEFDFDLACPKCGHSPTKWSYCDNYYTSRRIVTLAARFAAEVVAGQVQV